MTRCLLPLLLGLTLAACASSGASGSADVPKTLATSPEENAGMHARNEELRQRAQQQRDARVVFLGDSITQGWEGAGRAVWEREFAPLGALNLGVSGDRTEHVLWRLQEAPIARLKPRAVVILIGTNNLGHGSSDAEQTLAGVRAVVARVREQAPAAAVLLLEIFPRGERLNPMRGDIAQIAFELLHAAEQAPAIDLELGLARAPPGADATRLLRQLQATAP